MWNCSKVMGTDLIPPPPPPPCVSEAGTAQGARRLLMGRDEAKGLVHSWDHQGKTAIPRDWRETELEQHHSGTDGEENKNPSSAPTPGCCSAQTEIQSSRSAFVTSGKSKRQILPDLWSTAAHSPPKNPPAPPSFSQARHPRPPGCSQHHTQMATPAQVPSKSKAWHRFPAGKWIFHPEQAHSSLSFQLLPCSHQEPLRTSHTLSPVTLTRVPPLPPQA